MVSIFFVCFKSHDYGKLVFLLYVYCVLMVWLCSDILEFLIGVPTICVLCIDGMVML